MKNLILGRFSIKFLLISIVTYLLALLICFVLAVNDEYLDFSAIIFDLAVIVTARFTDGYIYGVSQAVLGTVTVSYAFMYPYMNLDFSIAEAFFTFSFLLATAIIVCMLTSQIKVQAQETIAAERIKIRSSLLRSLSHNLRTPLTALSGNVSALIESRNQIDDDTQEELMRDAEKQIQRLIKMVENILTITKIEVSENISLDCEPIEEVIGSAIQKFSSRCPDTEVLVDIPSEPLFVPIEPILIEQVLINLMDNSVIHGGTTTQIKITVKRQNDNILCRISDNGIGLSKEMIEDQFNFLREDTNSDRNIGIGLSLCEAVVRLHGGAIKGYNDGGAVIEFTLPLQKK